jgi:phosphoglycerol transferase MdoB-like AlkP superfamily enzyme
MDGGVYRGMYITSDTIRRSQSLSSAGFHTADIVQTLFGQVTEGSFSAQDEQLYDAYFSWKNSDTKESIYTGGFKGYNLLVIQVESLESFMLDQTLDGQEITPTLNRLMKEGYYFPNIQDQAKCGNSSDSDFMLMTGLLPTNRGYAFGSYADNDYHSLQTILKENGDYTSYYFHGAANATWNYEEMLADALKVDNLVMDYDQSEQLNGYLSDESFFEQTLELLSQQPLTEPFYAHVVTCSSHIPCNVPEGFEGLHMDKELEEHPMGQYLQAIHYTDRQIGVFLDELENRGILENTLIAVVGDHGGVHKYYPHYVAAMDEEISEEWFLRDNDYTLPLILYNENIEDPKIFSVTGGQIDVLPSLLSLLGVDTDTMEKVMLGRDLFSTSRDFAFRDEEVLYGSLSDSDRAVAKTMFYLSDLMMRSNRLTD